MYNLTGFQRDLLYVIAGMNEPHGLAVKSSIEDYYDKNINHGRLYPNMDTLVDFGYVEKNKFDKRTNKYTITKEGKKVIQQRREWENDTVDSEENKSDFAPKFNVD